MLLLIAKQVSNVNDLILIEVIWLHNYQITKTAFLKTIHGQIF